ncbi:MAG TPA: hypothetical protein DCG75_09985 [Bacteroidales bacterium]|nr:hypothetical protein [Bacteroidales bacterium]
MIITTDVNWTISTDSWISTNQLSGSGNVTISVNCLTSSVTREGEIKITGGGFTKVVYVNQVVGDIILE